MGARNVRATHFHAHDHSARARCGTLGKRGVAVHREGGHLASYFAVARHYLGAVDDLSRERYPAGSVLARGKRVTLSNPGEAQRRIAEAKKARCACAVTAKVR